MKDWPFDYFKYIANLNPEVLSRNMGTDFAPPGGGGTTLLAVTTRGQVCY